MAWKKFAQNYEINRIKQYPLSSIIKIELNFCKFLQTLPLVRCHDGRTVSTGDSYYESVVADPDGNLVELSV